MKCFYCKTGTMVEAPELGKDWTKCDNCGATDEGKVSKLVRGDLTKLARNVTTGRDEYSPSDWVTRRAKKAREG